MKIQVKNIKIYERMSEETTAFTADIFVDGQKVGYAKNDGHGGCSDYSWYEGYGERIRQAEAYCKQTPDYSLERLIDEAVDAKYREQFEKKLKKDMERGICYGTEESYSLEYWPNYTIETLLKHPKGLSTIQNAVNKLVERGETILNSNLTGITF